MKKNWVTTAGFLLVVALFASMVMLGSENATTGEDLSLIGGGGTSDNEGSGSKSLGKGTVQANVSGIVIDSLTLQPTPDVRVSLGGSVTMTDVNRRR
jgi:hypothetical protein